ncbi:urease accessory protein UreF [Sneathiella sp. P13V-1]|nr:urease accessory protein UreF [Sneathiella sp. P13V-1]
MTDVQDNSGSVAGLYELFSWMSPSYPIGAYTYSHGVEYAVEAGFVKDISTLIPWLRDILEIGGGRNDAILYAESYRAVRAGDLEKVKRVAEIGFALRPTKELDLETSAQGRAFLTVTNDVFPSPSLEFLKNLKDIPLVYPVVVGAATADKGVSLEAGLTAYLHGIVSNLVSAAVRIIPLGQTDGQRAIAALSGDVAVQVQRTLEFTIEDLGSSAMMVDWCSCQHETQYTRLFRS